MHDETYWLKISFGILAFGIFLFFRRHKKLKGGINYVSPIFLFLFGYLIVFYQIPIYHLLGFELKSAFLVRFVWAREYILLQSIFLSCAGLFSFLSGVIYFGYKYRFSFSRRSGVDVFYSKSQNSSPLVFLAYLLLLTFLIITPEYVMGSHHINGVVNGYVFLLFQASLIASISLRYYAFRTHAWEEVEFISYLRFLGLDLLFLASVFICFSLYVGDRGPVITYSILILGPYFFKYKRLSLAIIIPVLLIMGIFFTLLGEARRLGSGNAISNLKIVQDSKKENTSKRFQSPVPIEQTIELAMSIRCLNYSILDVTEGNGLHYGYFQFKQLASIIPGGGRMAMILTNRRHPKYDGSSAYTTYLIQGDKPKYGDGTTCVSDVYLDFGIIGVVIFFFLFGRLYKQIEYLLSSNNETTVFLIITSLVYFAFSIYSSRSSLLFQVKYITFAYLITLCNYYIFTYNTSVRN